MLEVDTTIIDANELTMRVNASMREKNIPRSFYGENMVITISENSNLYEMKLLLNTLYQNYQTMESMWVISEQPIVSSRKYIGKIIVFCKRAFRKLTRWLLQPYMVQQSNFNGAVLRSLGDLIKIQDAMIADYEENKK